MNKNKLIVKTVDKTFEHDITFAHVFTINYDRKIKKYEFHCPRAAKLIFETENSIFQYILFQAIIKSDKKGNILVMSPYSASYLLGEKPYFAKNEKKEVAALVKLYKQKVKLGLSIEEITEFNMAKSALELQKLEKNKIIPYDVGGGF